MKFFGALMGQYEVVHALTIRETRTRFGAHQLGYLWALVEPALMILTFYVLFAFAGRSAPTGMTLFSFIATGICPFLIFSSTVTFVSNAINGNKALLYYPQVNPIDVVIARVFLEFATYVGVFLVLLGLETLVLRKASVSDPLLIVYGFGLASLLGAGLGLVFLGLGQLSNAMERARGPLMRPFFWVSGIFFTADGMPPQARELVLWNPVLHTVELCRAGWFERYNDTHATPSYALIWAVCLLLVGLLLERVVRRKIDLT
ncbi:MAG: ABC transporter permease [Kofleriaceae bacterium]|nr:ABC transporter permease [Kofleriaceae bacterium]